MNFRRDSTFKKLDEAWKTNSKNINEGIALPNVPNDLEQKMAAFGGSDKAEIKRSIWQKIKDFVTMAQTSKSMYPKTVGEVVNMMVQRGEMTPEEATSFAEYAATPIAKVMAGRDSHMVQQAKAPDDTF